MTGTAGAGKSLLVSKIYEHYEKKDIFVSILNLDPGVKKLPYNCDVDIRKYVDTTTVMKRYNLGPNGAAIMATDILATNINDIQFEVDSINPEYLIIDTPGQIELFTYRNSGPFLIQSLHADEKINIFLYDGSIINTPINFVSISLLAASIRLRLNIPTINVLTKIDIIKKLDDVLKWSTEPDMLERVISEKQYGVENYTFITSIVRSLNMYELVNNLIPVSNVTNEGINNLEIMINRIMNSEE